MVRTGFHLRLGGSSYVVNRTGVSRGRSRSPRYHIPDMSISSTPLSVGCLLHVGGFLGSLGQFHAASARWCSLMSGITSADYRTTCRTQRRELVCPYPCVLTTKDISSNSLHRPTRYLGVVAPYRVVESAPLAPPSRV
jgi:hypothetical protein